MKTKANLIDFAGHPLGEPVVPTNVTGQAITATLPDGIKKFTLQVDTDIAGGAITINGTALKTPSGDDVTELLADTMFYDVVQGTSNFILPPKGTATQWAAIYDGLTESILDTKGNPVTVKVGDTIYNEPNALRIIEDGGEIIDVNTEVVAQNYSTIGNGGRKIVKLDDGTIVVAMHYATTNIMYLYKSDDNGETWSELYNFSTSLNVSGSFAISTDGTYVYIVYGVSGYFRFRKIDSSGLLVGSVIDVDTGQNTTQNGSLVVAPNGDLHACWASKNASYPNSFNIRYSKSTDGGSNWSSVEQLTTENTTNRGHTSPSIVIKNDGNPLIVTSYNLLQQSNYAIGIKYFNGTSWIGSWMYITGSYIQANPCVDKLSDGTLIVAWQGLNATYPSAYSLYFSQSTDNGVTWSTPIVVRQATSAPFNYNNPSIVRDNDDNIYILASKYDSGTRSLASIKSSDLGVTWDVDVIIQSGPNVNPNPSTCISDRLFDRPLVVYDWNSTSVRFDGAFSTVPTQTIPALSDATPTLTPIEGETVQFDVNTEVVASAYSTVGNGGRKIVKLDDGTIVVVLKADTGRPLFYKSLDNGTTWEIIGGVYNDGYTKSALATDGLLVYCLLGFDNGTTYVTKAFKFDPSLYDSNNQGNFVTLLVDIDSSQTAMGDVSITIAPNGDLHATWASKNASYPNSFNIRYSKSTDGGANWSSVEQITSVNVSGRDLQNPSIVIMTNGYPLIVREYAFSTGSGIGGHYFNGSVWTQIGGTFTSIYHGGSYLQSNPSIDKLSDGTLIVAWKGYNASEATYHSIYFSQSTDNGVTWSTPLVVAQASSTVYYYQPTITRDNDDIIHIIYPKYKGASNVDLVEITSSDGVTWSDENVIDNTVDNQFPNSCIDERNFIRPLIVYEDGSTVRFDGAGEAQAYETTYPELVATVAGSLERIAGTTNVGFKA